MKWIFAACLLLCAVTVQAGEIAYTVRATELKARPFTDAETLLNLAERSKVEILVRQSSWMRIRADGTTGWVKMLSLRLGNAEAQNKSGDSGIGALFNVVSTGSSGSSVTTGVRGLSEENLKNAHPNPQALQTMQGYAASKKDAIDFAKTGKLNSQQIDYLSLPGKGAN
ncbi:MAG TPA: SH3 domain-containing protein [Gallionella sp.]|jgi:hypothetical protein|nr:SH3 domain-containing protein [Gallionella sp.]